MSLRSEIMVSTRGPKYTFSEGEKVLCYEPDPTKAKVLYDSKVLGIYEAKDKKGRKVVQYKIHFQGWNPSWDRRVNSNFVLKDTEENRQLQRDLAERSKLHLGSYLYRKELKKRKRKLEFSETSAKIFNLGLPAEDNLSSASTLEKNNGDISMRDDCESESYSSSVESFHDDDRVMLRVSEKLKQYLEYDYEMVVQQKKQHILPARIPAVTILENFVKQSAIKLVFSSQPDNPRRRNPILRPDKREREFEKLFNTINLLKEVADGLRIYFDFTLTSHLLYTDEKEQAADLLSEENLKNFCYVASVGLSPEILLPKGEAEIVQTTEEPSQTSAANDVPPTEEYQKRKLRSHRSEEPDVLIENGLSSIASTSSGGSTPLHTSFPCSGLGFIKAFPPINLGIPPQTKEYLQKVLAWQMLPSNAEPEPSMIFGAAHLARLIVKLPEFLNATKMREEKLKLLLHHLDSFVSFLESHKEWFGDQNYFKDSNTTLEDTIKPEET